MKSFIGLFLCSFFLLPVFGQTIKQNIAIPDSTKQIQIAELSCGKCKFGLPGKNCDLAIRINDKAYYVNGASIDAFGDAHAKDGFCNAIRKAAVQGEIVDNHFMVTYLKLIPLKAKADE
jgi:Family of unknown function (DUF6370)